MASPPTNGGPARGARLPRRDWLLLPLVSLMTVLAMFVLSEVGSRVLYAEKVDNACRIPDVQLSYRFKPNCTTHTKVAEGPWVTDHYNSCGYRSAEDCGPVPAGTRRVALLGSSLSEGYMVPYRDTIGASLGAALTRLCHAPVQVQNLGGTGYVGHKALASLHEALALKPDAAVTVVTYHDVEDESDLDALPGSAWDTLHTGALTGMQRVFALLKESRAVVVAQHFLFQNMALYLPLYLHYGDQADFLRPPFTPAWQRRLNHFDLLIGRMAQQTHAASVPFMLVHVPQQAQAALLADRDPPRGVDPRAFGEALGAIAARHGVLYLDFTQDMEGMTAPERLYYPVNGHLSDVGQPILAKAIAQRFVDGAVPAFSDCLGSGAYQAKGTTR